MKIRIITAVIFVPLVFIVMFFLPSYVLAGVVSLICAISAYELLHAIGGTQNKRVYIYAIVAAVIIPIGAYFELLDFIFPAVLLILMSLMFMEGIIAFGTVRKVSFAQILITLFVGAIMPLMLSTLVNLKMMPGGHLFVLIPVIVAFLTDAGAYFTGMAIGKKKAFPLVSPKKTVEGCIGGLVVGILSLLIYGIIIVSTSLNEVSFWILILYGTIGAVFSQLGDLAFSIIKREFQIKDYGQLIPGHGGMLDRFDSMVFAAPALYLLVTVISAITISYYY